MLPKTYCLKKMCGSNFVQSFRSMQWARLSTVSDRAFLVTAARTWNSLLQHVAFAPFMSVYWDHVKAFFFRPSSSWPFATTFLHWLRDPERITYKLCILANNCLHGMAPRYLQDVIQPVAEVTSRRRLRSASSSALVVPATRRLQRLDHVHETVCPSSSLTARHLSPSRNISTLICLVYLLEHKLTV